MLVRRVDDRKGLSSSQYLRQQRETFRMENPVATQIRVRLDHIRRDRRLHSLLLARLSALHSTNDDRILRKFYAKITRSKTRGRVDESVRRRMPQELGASFRIWTSFTRYSSESTTASWETVAEGVRRNR